MVATSPPITGTFGTTLVANSPSSIGGVGIGFSKSIVAGLPLLPLSLAGLGMPGCYVLHSNEVFGLPLSASGPGLLEFSVAIPNTSNVLGLQVYLQAYCYAPGANALEIIASNGIDWVIGNQ